MMTTRPNVRGWRTGAAAVKAGGSVVLGAPDPVRLRPQVDRWATITTMIVVVVLLAVLSYFDALTGFWLGAVLGRLALGALVLFSIAACVIGASGQEPKP